MRFDHAVEQYTTYLLKLSYLNVRNKQTAEDIVQDVFIKLYEKFGDIIPLEHTKSYLVTMTMNRCRDYFKSWHYRKVQLTEVFSKDTKSQESHFFAEDNAQSDLIQGILKLPRNYREIIILYYYDEQSTNEVAKTLNIPVGTVKTRLQRARQLLKEHIKEAEVTLHAQKN